jgi:hypothetical protein
LAEQCPNFVRIIERQTVKSAVIAIALLMFANIAAESGVLRKIILAPLSFGIRYFSWVGLGNRFATRIRAVIR